MSNREQKLTTTLGKKLKQPQLREKRSRRARGLRALNLPTTATGTLQTAENGSLSDDGHKSNAMREPLGAPQVSHAAFVNKLTNNQKF